LSPGQQTMQSQYPDFQCRHFDLISCPRRKGQWESFLENYLSVFLAMHLPSDATTHYKCAKHCALLSKHEEIFFGQILSQYISGHFLITEHTIRRQEHQTSEIESVAATTKFQHFFPFADRFLLWMLDVERKYHFEHKDFLPQLCLHK